MHEQTKEKLAAGALAILAVAAVAYLWHSADVRTAAAEAMSACVVHTAEAEGYHGNAYGPEAWDIFAPSCEGRTWDFIRNADGSATVYVFATGQRAVMPVGTQEDDISVEGEEIILLTVH
mgnify:CR=1 FL=1